MLGIAAPTGAERTPTARRTAFQTSQRRIHLAMGATGKADSADLGRKHAPRHATPRHATPRRAAKTLIRAFGSSQTPILPGLSPVLRDVVPDGPM